MIRPLTLGAAISLFLLAGRLVSFAANQAPELYQAVPTLTLASGAAAAPLTLSNYLRDPDVPGTAVRVSVRLGSQTADLYLGLYDAAAPLTVANFKNYIISGAYASNFFHRSVPGFIIQNGGFRFLSDTTYGAVPTSSAIQNEPGISNLRGTIAMAKLGGDPNSATSQWFINLADNSADLDAQNGGFTVFGRVLGDGMANIVDVLANVTRYDASAFNAAWNEIPLNAPSLARANFIETNAALVSPLSFQVTVDDPTLVTASLTEGVLQLAGSASLAGQTTVRLTTTDLEGGGLVSSFPVTVLSSSPRIAWRQTYFATTADTGTAADPADPDSDGVPNLLEYALGTDPNSAASNALPSVSRLTTPSALLTLTYKRAASDLAYVVQTTTNLADSSSWTAVGVDQGIPAGDGTTIATIPYTTGLRFLRLHVSITP
ncbi:MAG: peptidylprolyl isomerase [Verrucomicrobia bacterium]|nr:peptidylprolyl isomerase [Verrucomicrobiota bacterium]